MTNNETNGNNSLQLVVDNDGYDAPAEELLEIARELTEGTGLYAEDLLQTAPEKVMKLWEARKTKEAEERAQQEAEERARQKEEERAQKEAEEKARQEALDKVFGRLNYQVQQAEAALKRARKERENAKRLMETPVTVPPQPTTKVGYDDSKAQALRVGNKLKAKGDQMFGGEHRPPEDAFEKLEVCQLLRINTGSTRKGYNSVLEGLPEGKYKSFLQSRVKELEAKKGYLGFVLEHLHRVERDEQVNPGLFKEEMPVIRRLISDQAPGYEQYHGYWPVPSEKEALELEIKELEEAHKLQEEQEARNAKRASQKQKSKERGKLQYELKQKLVEAGFDSSGAQKLSEKFVKDLQEGESVEARLARAAIGKMKYAANLGSGEDADEAYKQAVQVAQAGGMSEEDLAKRFEEWKKEQEFQAERQREEAAQKRAAIPDHTRTRRAEAKTKEEKKGKKGKGKRK